MPDQALSTACTQPIFYYDLGSPECYLLAEQVLTALPVVPEWEPVLWDGEPTVDQARVERRAAELGLQPIRWPPHLPPDSRIAMLAATYAKQIGRAVAFSLAAFRQAFAAGRDLASPDTVLIAGAACEIHPTALLRALERQGVAKALSEATGRAHGDGVESLPAIRIGENVFWGEQMLQRAAEAPPA